MRFISVTQSCARTHSLKFPLRMSRDSARYLWVRHINIFDENITYNIEQRSHIQGVPYTLHGRNISEIYKYSNGIKVLR